MSRATHEENVRKASLSAFQAAPKSGSSRYRQRYHFMPPAYWMNDPNGLIQFNGLYHLFYQHYPYDAKWGAMHWGHAISSDLVHWRHMPISLAPSEIYDECRNGGCFSGSAVDNDGVLSVLYTGTVSAAGDSIQRQCLAYSADGVRFTKYEGNPVIEKVPADGSGDFRDPKVWKHGSMWYMIAGSCRNNCGKALLFKSGNLKEWDYVGVAAESRGELGTMWECPDFFELGETAVLMFSPIGIRDRKTCYISGKFDYKTGKLFWNCLGEVDWGFDFYAPQTFADNMGRRILIGWTNSWDWMPWYNGFGPVQKDHWCGSMSLPRTVELCPDGKLRFEPVDELKSIRKNHKRLRNLTVTDQNQTAIEPGDGISYEIEATIDLKSTDASEFGFLLRCGGGRKTAIIFDLKGGRLVFDRSHSDEFSSGVRYCSLESVMRDTVQIHLFADTCSVEVFTDNGRTVMSGNIYPSEDSRGAFLFANGGSAQISEMEMWELGSVWKTDTSNFDSRMMDVIK